MADNRITIGKDHKEKQSQDKSIYETPKNKHSKPLGLRQRTTGNKIWGNETEIDKKLDEEALTEKRRYVRVRYIQRIECSCLSENMQAEPKKLAKPVILNMFDISLGGIGAVCEEEIKKGSVLYIYINLDQLPYEVKCEVMYCVPVDNSYRIGLSLIREDKAFIRHLKVIVARLSFAGDFSRGGE
ncbi:MAG: PilZ domain-containing protein [Clostridia bacterium]|nr:PilZ domain-containing protein [Clostridia bacterium]